MPTRQVLGISGRLADRRRTVLLQVPSFRREQPEWRPAVKELARQVRLLSASELPSVRVRTVIRFAQLRLRSCEPRNRDPWRRARNVVQAGIMAEAD